MNLRNEERKRWIWVVLFAMAMAWVESAVVYYLRLWMGGEMNPYQTNPIPNWEEVGLIEVIREAATMVMLLTVGLLAGRNGRSRLGYALIAFGVWDIFYYVFLKVITGWPISLLDWDILFLIPLPWWGPVIAPVSIALLMITWGTLVSQFEISQRPGISSWKVWSLCFLGVVIALTVFMADALQVIRGGGSLQELREMLPTVFHWPFFLIAWALMAAPVIDLSRQVVRTRSALSDESAPG